MQHRDRFALGLMILTALPLLSATPAGAWPAAASLRTPGAFTAIPGRLVNADARDHDLELSCPDGSSFTARVAARETVLLGAPVAAGCELHVLDARAALRLDGFGPWEIRIEDGVPILAARLLKWAPVSKVYGDTGPWQRGKKGQWARVATASSEYSRPDWSAEQAIGAPDTLRCGDIPTAWATRQAQSNKPEWIELGFARKVRAVGARLRVTNGPGAVRKVLGKTGWGWATLWEGKDPTATCPAVLMIRFREEIDTDTLKIVLDTSQQSTWWELDAVELLGRPL